MKRLIILFAFFAVAGCDDGDDPGGGNPRTGDPTRQDMTLDVDDAMTESDAGADACTDGARRCTADGIEICNQGRWAELADCPVGTICDEGACVDKPCEADCNNRVCGDDGCDGICGDCAEGESCTNAGQCEPEAARCGDDTCDDSESCSTCPADCGNCCGDGACDDASENCATCLADCACGEGESCSANTQMCEACVPQCDGRECGDDGCGGNCGICADSECLNGICDLACVPQCDGRVCGDDGCGGICGMCNGGDVCNAEGVCNPPPAACGDAECDAGEDCSTCPADCGQCCGDGACVPGVGENCATCLADCACPEGEACNDERRACVPVCVPQCDGQNCGDDGCGGNCGLCDDNQACEGGVCRDQCVPQCDGRACGGDGCDGSCGLCADGQLCNDGVCADECIPRCNGRECGVDGCGGLCGNCEANENCNDGTCEPRCVPDCNGRACGGDGCGRSCGACDEGEMCSAAGQCMGGELACDCENNEVCLDGFCRLPEQLCSDENPVGLCISGQDCLAGVCENRGNGCSPQNPTGVCAVGEICRDGVCAAFDGEALCDDLNDCTADRFDHVANRCANEAVNVACSDGNGCTMNRCDEGLCLADRVPGCIEPPTIDPYVTPTNVGDLTLSGTKPMGASIRINGMDAIPEGPEAVWSVDINLQPGENIFTIQSVDMGVESAEVEVRIVYDITPPTVAASPEGGVFLNPVSVTVAASEASRVFYTADGGTPDQWSKSFRSAKEFRIFHDTTLRFRARDAAGNWQDEIVEYGFEITGFDNGWSAIPPLPEPRTLAAATTTPIGNLIYVIGGTDGLAPQTGVYRTNDAMEWEAQPSLDIARAQHAAVALNNDVYVVGGESDGLPLNLLQRFGPGEEGWVNLAPMPSTRFGLSANLSDLKIYVFGGKTNGGRVLPTVEAYSIINNVWTNELAQMPRPRFGHQSVEVEGFIYLIGGEDEDGVPIAEVDRYDIANDAWDQIEPLPTPRSRLTVTVHRNIGDVVTRGAHIVVAGGLVAGGAATAIVESYDIEDGVWRARSPLLQARHSAAGAHRIGQGEAQADVAYQQHWTIGGQADGEVTGSGEQFLWNQDYVTLQPDLPAGRFMQAVEEANGLFYIFGGRSFQEIDLVWAYDPETGRTIERAPLPRLQNGLGSAVIDDQIYAIGGANNFGIAVPWLHRYDPALDTWEALNPMPTARRDPAVTVLDGRIWVIGGDNNGPLQTVEIYDPATDEWSPAPVLPQGRTGSKAIVHDGEIILTWGVGDDRRFPLRRLVFREGEWSRIRSCAGRCDQSTYAAAVLVHDHQLNVISGSWTNRLYDGFSSTNLLTGELTTRVADAPMYPALNYAGLVYHLGRIYLVGGNTEVEPGPEGLSTVLSLNGRCYNGIRDGREESFVLESEWDNRGGCANLNARSYQDGDIRNDNGIGLQILHENRWGYVCDDGWTQINTDVACRQLLGPNAIGLSHSGRVANADFWMDDVACAGDEERLADCRFPGWGVHNCARHEGIFLSCVIP